MSEFVTIDTTEVRALAGALAARSATIARDAVEAVSDAADFTEGFAKAIAPVDTGEYREGIQQEGRGLERTVEATADHSVYVEFGTSSQAPQPTMFPAADRGEALLAEELEDEAAELF